MNKVSEDSVFVFYIYTNPRSSIKYILFRGVGNVENNHVNVLHNYDYLVTKKGYKKLRNYYDMLEKFGAHKCRIVDEDFNIIDDVEYESQDEIAKKFEIKVSRLQKRAFKETDVVGSKKIIRLTNK